MDGHEVRELLLRQASLDAQLAQQLAIEREDLALDGWCGFAHADLHVYAAVLRTVRRRGGRVRGAGGASGARSTRGGDGGRHLYTRGPSRARRGLRAAAARPSPTHA